MAEVKVLFGAVHRFLVSAGLKKTAKQLLKELDNDLEPECKVDLIELYAKFVHKEQDKSKKDANCTNTPKVGKKRKRTRSMDCDDVEEKSVENVEGDKANSDSSEESSSSSESEAQTDSSSDSESSDEEDEDGKTAANKRAEEEERKRKQAIAAALAWTPQASPSASASKGTPKSDKKSPGTAFRRVDGEFWSGMIKKDSLKDNSYEGTFGESGFGSKASAILVNVRGKDFRHEKTKKKRGNYKGGTITLASHSIKFSDGEDE